MATHYTPNYNLDLYASTDKPNLRDQYNAAMGKIDTQMKKSADDVTNANANVLTLKSQMTEAQNDITALESTVETHGTQITSIQNTADGALSLAQTNESDIADTQSNVTSLTSRVATVEGTANRNKTGIASLDTRMGIAESNITKAQQGISGKAPTNHASAANTYGQGSSTNFGHVKVTDTAGSTAASTGTAASPAGVQSAIKEWLTPTIVQLPNPSSGSWGPGLHQCAVYKLWKIVKFTFELNLSGSNNPDFVTIGTCSALGIPKPSSERTIFASVRAYVGRPNPQTFIGDITVLTNGNIRVDGWNTVSGSRVDWSNIASIQVMIDYSQW